MWQLLRFLVESDNVYYGNYCGSPFRSRTAFSSIVPIMAASSVASFMGVSLLLAITPGVDWAYVIATALRRGSAVPAVGGLLAGRAGHCLAVMVGVASLVAEKPGLLSALTAAGAAYLVWLGAVMAYRPGAVEAAAAPVRSALGTFLAGAGTSGLNPKGLILLLAPSSPSSRTGAALSLPLQIGVLGATHVLNCAVV